MLKFFRKHARGWFMLAVIAIIIIVFVLYFGSNKGSESASVVAIIDGRTISEAEFRSDYEKLLDMARMRYGANITPEILKQLNLKQKAYDSLISKHVIISKAADLKVQVSDEELKNMIMYTPALQTGGIFDERKYRQMLRYNRVSAEDFEAMQKVNLMAAKIESIVREGIKVSEREIYDIFILQNQKINLNYVQISGQTVRQKAIPTSAQLESYLKSNSNIFRRPEQVKIKYLYFSSDAFTSAAISDSEVRDYYNLNRDQFRKKDGKQASFAEVKNDIVKQFKQTRGMQKAYQEAKKARDVIYQEDNFEEYSNKNNLKINNLDSFFLNKPPKEFVSIKDFATEIMDMQKGEISKILVVKSGYYLLKLSDKKPAYLPQLKDIESEVRKHFMENEMNRLAAEEAQKISERLKAGEPFDKVAREKGLQINETGFFMPGDAIPKLGFHRDAAEILYQLSAGKPYAKEPLYINNNYIIVKLKGVSKVDMKDLEAKKDIYKKMLTSIKQEEAMQSWLEGNKAAMIKGKRINIKREVKDL